MHNDNAVLRKLNTVGSNACRGALIAAMTVSMMPTSAFAAAATTETGSEATNNAPISATNEETKSLSSEYSLSAVSDDATSSTTSYDLTKIADGTYEGTATADSNDPLNKAGDEWNAADGKYDVNVSVTIKSGKITKVEVADYSSLGDDDWDRMDKAVNGFSKKARPIRASLSKSRLPATLPQSMPSRPPRSRPTPSRLPSIMPYRLPMTSRIRRPLRPTSTPTATLA